MLFPLKESGFVNSNLNLYSKYQTPFESTEVSVGDQRSGLYSDFKGNRYYL